MMDREMAYNVSSDT